MATTNPDLLKDVQLQNDYCGVTKWHKAGYTGKNIVVWDMENSKVDHGQMTNERVKDAAPNATVINATWSATSKNNVIITNKAVLNDGTEYSVEDFIKKFNIKVLTRSIGGGLQRDDNSAFAKFWKEIIKKYNLIIFNSMGNEGNEDVDKSNEMAILVGACGLYKGKTPRRDNYSSTGKGIDFCDFRGWMDGTSFSAPYLAGKACLILERYGSHLTQEEVYNYFKDHCEDLEDKGEDKLTGWGLPIMGDIDEKYFKEEEGTNMKKTKFIDVKEGAWYENAIAYCVEKGYMAGTGNDTFSPEEPLTRAQLAQVLYNIDKIKK